MGRLLSTIVVAAACAGSIAFAADTPRLSLRTKPVVLDERGLLNPPLPATRPTAVATGAAASPGYLIGFTYHDLQQYGTLGRQIDNIDGLVQVAWMKSYYPAATPRSVSFEQNGISGPAAPYTLDDGSSIRLYGWNIPLGLPPMFATENPGFVNTRAGSSIHAALTFHGRSDSLPPGPLVAQIDTSPLGFEYFGEAIAPQPSGSQYGKNPVLWPKNALSICGTDEILHVVGTSYGNDGEIWYWRGVVSLTAPYVTWDPPVLLGHDAYITAAVEAHGPEVAIAYIGDNSSINSDVMYIRSTDCGQSWQPPVNITHYTDNDPEGAYTELAMAYDPGGEVHIIWNTIPITGYTHPTNLYHWSASTGSRLITQAAWANDCVHWWWQWPPRNNGAGSGNTALSDPGLSIKPAGMGPGAGIADELIYATWTQFGPTTTDCATFDDVGTLGGYVNGEIYWSVSSDGGLTWDRPSTVTGTHTPDCLPYDCASEAWPTVAAVADSAVYMSYVLDKHAGVATLGEGGWTENPYMILALETRLPVLAPQILAWPIDFRDLYVDNLGSTDSVTFLIYNSGNGQLDFQIAVTPDDGGPSHIAINGTSPYIGSIPVGGPPETITVSFDGAGIPDYTENNWRLEITSNDSLNNPGLGGTAIDVTLQVFVAPEWYTCDTDTLSTGQHRLRVSSCLELGDQQFSGGGFYSYADSTDWLYTGSPVVTWIDNSSTWRAYRNIYMTAFDRTRDKNQSFRSTAPMVVTRDVSSDRATGTAVTTDSIIQLGYEMVAFKDPTMSNGAFTRYTMTSRSPDTLFDISFGAVVDFDVLPAYAGPGIVRNIGFASDPSEFIGVRAVAVDTLGIVAYLDRFAALFHIDYRIACGQNAVAAQAMDNADCVYPYAPGYPTDSLYALFDRFGQRGGFDAHTYNSGGQDTASDLSLLLVTGHHDRLDPGIPVEWGFGVAVSTVSRADLESQIAAIRVNANPGCDNFPVGCGAPYSGDVNESCSITSADIIYLVQYVFKGGPPPRYTVETGDVNCSGTVTSGDIIFLVTYVFKGGPAPPDTCP